MEQKFMTFEKFWQKQQRQSKTRALSPQEKATEDALKTYCRVVWDKRSEEVKSLKNENKKLSEQLTAQKNLNNVKQKRISVLEAELTALRNG